MDQITIVALILCLVSLYTRILTFLNWIVWSSRTTTIPPAFIESLAALAKAQRFIKEAYHHYCSIIRSDLALHELAHRIVALCYHHVGFAITHLRQASCYA